VREANTDRVYLNDSQFLVSVRYPGQWEEIRTFVRPNDPNVLSKYQELGPDVWACLDWVCRNISYRSDNGEWWGYPEETMKRRFGDCDDSAILLVSLLENFTNAYVAAGTYQGYGHAWGQLDGTILESTYTSARPVPDPQNYIPYALFNDKEVIELWPGALKQLFDLNHNELLKLSLMNEALEQGVSPTLPVDLFIYVLTGALGSMLAAIFLSPGGEHG